MRDRPKTPVRGGDGGGISLVTEADRNLFSLLVVYQKGAGALLEECVLSFVLSRASTAASPPD
jgi:hypothetical protein